MGWLRSHGMIARKTEDNNPDSIFVARWGHQALTKSLAEIRAVDRIRDNLHPLIEQRVRRQFLLGEYEQAVFVAMRAVEVPRQEAWRLRQRHHRRRSDEPCAEAWRSPG
jgi:hypothetical protein